MRALAFSALLLGAIGVPSASADHPDGTTDVSTRNVAGQQVEVTRHGDPRGEFVDGSDAAAPAPDSIGGRAAAPSTCPTVTSGTDDRANDPHGGAARVIKVIYAHPAGVGNRLPTYGPVIEAGVRSLAEFVALESGGSLSIRFDIGTFEARTASTSRRWLCRRRRSTTARPRSTPSTKSPRTSSAGSARRPGRATT